MTEQFIRALSIPLFGLFAILLGLHCKVLNVILDSYEKGWVRLASFGVDAILGFTIMLVSYFMVRAAYNGALP